MFIRFPGRLFTAALAVLGLLGLAATCLADEYSADMIQSMGGQTRQGKIYVKGGKQRMDMDQQGQKVSIIFDLATKQSIMINHSQKMYMPMPAVMDKGPTAEWSEESMKQFGEYKKVGSETVNGYKCDKYELIYKDQAMGKATHWITQKHKRPIKVAHTGGPGGGDMTMEYKNIQNGGVKDSVFDIPAGYTKMEIPGMGGGPGRRPQQ